MSIFEINGSAVACGLYRMFRSFLTESFLTEEYRAGQYHADALMVSFGANFDEFGFGPDGNTEHGYGARHVGRFIHFIMTGNVHVWSYVGQESDPQRVPLDLWQNVSNHDSCWRDGIDRVLTEVYFEGCDEVQRHLPKELQRAPAQVDQHNYLGQFAGTSNLFRFVDIEFRRSNADPLDYRFDLVGLKSAKKQLKLTEPETAE